MNENEKKFGLDLTNGRVSLRSMKYPRLYVNYADMKEGCCLSKSAFLKYLELPNNTEPKSSTVGMFDVEKLENGQFEILTRNISVSVQNGSIEKVVEKQANLKHFFNGAKEFNENV